MSDNKSGSMLLPLGLGAVGIFLYMAMKKKPGAESTQPFEEAAMLPPPAAVEAIAPNQIVPAAAPSYTQAVIQTASTEQEPEERADPDEQEPPEQEGEESDNEEEQEPTAASESSRYRPYTPVSTINVEQQQTASMPVIQITRNPARMVGSGKPALKSAVLLKKQQEFNKQKKVSRFWADQVRKLPLQQQYVSNGKLKEAGSYRPGVIAVPGTAITAKHVITRIPAVAKKVQSSIFPLKYGMMNNPYVRELQGKIGVPATGHFNTQTRNALRKRYSVQEVSEPLYKQIITGKAAVAVKKPVAKLFSKIGKILPKRKNVKRK